MDGGAVYIYIGPLKATTRLMWPPVKMSLTPLLRYINVESIRCTLETNIISYVNYILRKIFPICRLFIFPSATCFLKYMLLIMLLQLPKLSSSWYSCSLQQTPPLRSCPWVKINQCLMVEPENKLKYFNQLPFKYSLNFTHAFSPIRLTIAQHILPNSRSRTHIYF